MSIFGFEGDLLLYQQRVALLSEECRLLRKEAALARHIDGYRSAVEQYKVFAAELRELGVRGMSEPIPQPKGI